MAICCDYCGKEATISNLPDGVNWLKWMMDEKQHGDDAMIAMPSESSPGVVGVICYACVGKQVAEFNDNN